jgi:multiple sugar transport system substrate-binding protein
MQPKRLATFILFSALLVCIVVGCTPPPPVGIPTSQPLAGKTVRVACPPGPSAGIVRTYSKAWQSREGAAVEVLNYDPAAGPEQVKADVWVMAPAALPQRAAAGLLRKLPVSFTATDSAFGWMDLLPIYREKLLKWNRVLCAVPLAGESPLCVYRADFFADAARADAFQKKHKRPLAPPRTWEEFADLAEFFRETAKGGPAPSLPPLPADDAALDRELFTVAACYARRPVAADERVREPRRPAPDDRVRDDNQDQLFSFQYDYRSGKPRLSTPGFVAALTLLKRLQKCRPSGTAESPTDAFRDQNAALGLADVSLLTTLQKTPGMADKLGICRMPGAARWFEYASGKPVVASDPAGNRVPYLGSGGWLAVVPLGATEPDAAFGLLADLAGRERSVQIMIDPIWGGGPTRRDHLERTRWDAFGLEPERTRALKDALRQTLEHPSMQNPAVCLRTSAAAKHEAALLKEVRAFLTSKDDDAQKALEKAVARWEEMDKERGHEAARDDYQISVGLLPTPER